MSYLRLAKYCFGISIAAMAVSLVLMVVPGPRLSIDFTGGTLMEVTGATAQEVQSAAESITLPTPLGIFTVVTSSDGNILLRMRDLSPEEHNTLLNGLQQALPAVQETQYTTIGPTVGTAVKQKAITALILACIGIILYIGIAFRAIPRRLSSWRFGIVTVITLIHDVLVTTGVFTILSHTTDFEVDSLFVTALLTIMGYSVNDTIVIFDRIRENVTVTTKNEPFEHVATRSVRESLTRSVNTSVSVLIMLAALSVFGPGSTRWFALTLLFGIGIGTYSSIFLATPLLIYWRKRAR